MISQISPKLLGNFITSVRKGKNYTKLSVLDRLQKKGLLKGARDHVLIKELIGVLYAFKVVEAADRDNCFVLSEFGRALKSLYLRNQGLFYEIYHLLHYYAFDLNSCDYRFLPFRSYQLMCDWVFDSMQYPNAISLADKIDFEIKETYSVQGSFSEVCITRGLAWLKELKPPVVDNDRNIILRKPDDIETMLFNMSCYYKVKSLNYGDPLFLDSTVVRDISRASFLDSNNFEDIVRECAALYPSSIKFKYNISGFVVTLSNHAFFSDFL